MDAALSDSASASANSLLRERRELFSMLHQFALLPSRSLHPSWIDEVYPRQAAPLLSRANTLDLRTHRWLSAHLLEGAGMGEHEAFALRPALAFALLAPARLRDLAASCGAVWLARELHEAVRGDTARELRESFGESLWSFALERAPLLIADAERAEFRVPARSRDLGHAQWAEHVGAALLREASADRGSLWSRLRLKLPRETVVAVESWEAVADAARALRVVMRILRELEPAWHSSFARALAQ